MMKLESTKMLPPVPPPAPEASWTLPAVAVMLLSVRKRMSFAMMLMLPPLLPALAVMLLWPLR